MSSYYFDEFSANFSQTSAITNPGDVFADVNDFASSERYDLIPIYYPVPAYYEIYNGVSPVEVHGTTFYNYHQFAVPVYSYFPQLTTETNDVSYPEESMNDYSENLNEESFAPQLIAENNDESSVRYPEESTNDYSENVFEESNLSLDDKTRVKSEEEDQSAVIADILTELVHEVSSMSRFNDPIPLTLEEENKHNVASDNSEENLESSKSGLDKVIGTDVPPLLDKCDGDHDEEFRNYAKIEPPNDSVKKSRDCLEGKESMKDSFFDGTDSLENNEFKIEACYKGSSEKNELNIDSSCKNNVDEYHSNLPVSSSNLSPKDKIRVQLEEEGEFDEIPEILIDLLDKVEAMDTSPHIDKGEGDKECENEAVIKSTDEGMQQISVESEKNCGLKEQTNEVSPTEKPKKKRCKGIRSFFSGLTKCFRKSKEEPPG